MTRPITARGRGPIITDWRSAPSVLALLAVALLVTACGGSAKTAAPATTTTTGRGARNQEFVQCMKSHGVTVTAGGRGGFRGGGGPPGSDATGTTRPTTPTTLPPGVTQQQYDAAIQACRSLLPAPGQNIANNPAFAVYRNCLQARGVTLPTPGQSTGSAATGGFGGLTNSTDPTVQAALKACASLRPTGGFGGGQGASTTTATS